MLSLYKQPIFKALNDHLVFYQSPVVINYFWGFGSLSGVFLIVQILTGIFLAMFYIPSATSAFSSVEFLIRDVNNGWFIRFMHSNGASFFFIVTYLHMFRSFFYAGFTYPREFVWFVGIAILFLMIGTAFIGYVLPWGQISFWGATVITNMVTAIPFIGTDLVNWVWGGFNVDDPTLHRFFSLHYLLPFVLLGLVVIHILALHQYGSNNPIGVSNDADKVSLHPYFTVKDIVGIFVIFIFYFYFVCFDPDYLNHPDNCIPANSIKTPVHITPEWYFLVVYAILRSIPNKLLGILSILAMFVAFFMLPFIYGYSNRAIMFRPFHSLFFWIWVGSCVALGWIGAKPVSTPYVEFGQLLSLYFFFYLLVINTVLSKMD